MEVEGVVVVLVEEDKGEGAWSPEERGRSGKVFPRFVADVHGDGGRWAVEG